MRYLRLAPLLLPVSVGAALALASFGSCVVSFSGYELGPDGGTGAASSATSGTSSGSSGTTSTTVSSTTTSSSSTTVSTSTASTGGTGGTAASSSGTGGCMETLEPGVVLPPPDAGPCGPASMNYKCPNEADAWSCVIAGPCSLACSPCINCNGVGSPCTKTTDCGRSDCYNGKCAAACVLGTQLCNAPLVCTPVGNSTFGICM